MKATSLVAVAALVVFASASTIHATDRQPAATECGDLGDTAPVNDGFPNRLSSLVGTDIRTGGHECFERVVLELGGSGELPGFQVQYEPDPILDSPSGEPVEVAGEATLVLSVGAWMPDIEGNGYQGPLEFVPTNVVNIEELQQIENFEGQNAWAIGLDMPARLHGQHAHRAVPHRHRHRPRPGRDSEPRADSDHGTDSPAPRSPQRADPRPPSVSGHRSATGGRCRRYHSDRRQTLGSVGGDEVEAAGAHSEDAEEVVHERADRQGEHGGADADGAAERPAGDEHGDLDRRAHEP